MNGLFVREFFVIVELRDIKLGESQEVFAGYLHMRVLYYLGFDYYSFVCHIFGIWFKSVWNLFGTVYDVFGFGLELVWNYSRTPQHRKWTMVLT